MMYRLLVCLALLWMPFSALSQHKTPTPLDRLKEGALLVRLKTNQTQADALTKLGKPQAAAKKLKEQEQKNHNLIYAFRKKYKFSPVYFFYPEHSQAVLDRNFAGIVFLTDNLQPDSSIKFSGGKFLTAEVTMLDQPEVKRTKSEIRRGVKYHDGNVTTFEALILKDENFEQLQEPFHVYIRTWDSLFLKRKAENLVRYFNSEIARKHKPKEYFPKHKDIN